MKIRIYFIIAILLSLFPLMTFGGEVHYYHTDNFGTPMAMTDVNGDVVWRTDELPFGEEYETIDNPIKNHIGFLGKEVDVETGLIYMGQRVLNPFNGRFNRPDPVGLVDPATGKVNQVMLLNPQRQNRYVYGLNNPYRYVDPDGNSPVETDGTIALRKEASGVVARSIQRSKQFADFATAVGSAGLIRGMGIKGSNKVNLKEVGSYTNTHASGKTYSGKGSRLRSQQSGRRQARKSNDPHTATDFTSAKGTRDAFKQESRRIDANGGVKNASNYNKIESPGRRYRKEDK